MTTLIEDLPAREDTLCIPSTEATSVPHSLLGHHQAEGYLVNMWLVCVHCKGQVMKYLKEVSAM